jgi:hypothetical protein
MIKYYEPKALEVFFFPIHLLAFDDSRTMPRRLTKLGQWLHLKHQTSCCIFEEHLSSSSRPIFINKDQLNL